MDIVTGISIGIYISGVYLVISTDFRDYTHPNILTRAETVISSMGWPVWAIIAVIFRNK